ncbi:aminotransferase class I/II-fold pyridoxal phosphate-dependent enzyme [Phenylobacterium sp.]|uniref:aminotransferase class I/II-fold pyridoxal phosphate-dependent enzyme n=1 Tax=Phenylobacterium sp. TaxID=1871053 RepID=UPI002F3E2338
MTTALEVLFRHGGRLAAAKAAFPDAPQPWIDLSTGINPRPWRGARAASADLRRLPDPEAVAALEAAAARSFGAAPAAVAAVPGAEAGLRLLPRLTGARSAAIVAPTYGGHAEAWAAAGVAAAAVRDLDDDRAAEALVAVNPNNPDGSAIPPGRLAAQAARRWVIVDESFGETVPDLTLASRAGGRLVVLRSFGKFYGLPGVRLGFVVAEPALAARVRAAFGDWPVGAEALAAAPGAYADEAWRARTVRRLAGDAARLDARLAAAGFEVLGGTSLFRLARRRDAAAAFRALAGRGVLARPFRDHPHWLRFGLPAPGQWPRVEAALQELRP